MSKINKCANTILTVHILYISVELMVNLNIKLDWVKAYYESSKCRLNYFQSCLQNQYVDYIFYIFHRFMEDKLNLWY